MSAMSARPSRGFESNYISRAMQCDMLTAEEEQDLARRWRDSGDEDALGKLVVSHLRLVAKIAHGHRRYGVPVSELIGEGNLGLVLAARRFDPDRGFRFSTYAMWWIRAAVREYALRNNSLVKMGTTAAQKTLFFNLHRMKERLGVLKEGDLEAEIVGKIARSLNVADRDVVEMNRRLAGPDRSLNASPSTDGETEWQDRLASDEDGQDVELAERDLTSTRKSLLAEAIGMLRQREMLIVSERWFRDQPTTLEALSQRLGVSRERVRQIEVRALQKLRRTIKDMPRTAFPRAA